MRNSIQSNTHPLDLTANDLREIISSIGLRTGSWSIRMTCAPGPDHNVRAVRWMYLFWSGPLSEYPVPSIAVTRCSQGYRITIMDPLYFFESGNFETIRRESISEATRLLCEIIKETEGIALDHPARGMSSCLESRRQLYPDRSQDIEELEQFPLSSIHTDVVPS